MSVASKEGAPGALQGVRIVDFSHALAGPYATMVLSDLGAEVLKVEHPGGGDRSRRFTDGQEDFSPYFGSVNRNKQSIVLDLKNPRGKEIALDLIDKADVMVQNMGPAVAERLGLSYADVAPRNPRLIYAVVTGFGLDGPWVNVKGVDPVIQALSGAMSITGEPSAPPVRIGYSTVDVAGGMWLAMGVLAALNERHASGKGQLLDVSLLEAQMAWMENAIVRHLDSGIVPQRMGSAHTYERLTRAYGTQDGWMVVGLTSRNWKQACAIWGREDWISDPRLQSDLPAQADWLVPEIQKILQQHPTQYWVDRLEPGISCTPIHTVAEAVTLPPIRERGFIAQTVDANGRALRVAGSPLRLSRTPGRVRAAAPLLGQHTHTALQSWLDISDDQFAQYEREGVFRQVERTLRGFW